MRRGTHYIELRVQREFCRGNTLRIVYAGMFGAPRDHEHAAHLTRGKPSRFVVAPVGARLSKRSTALHEGGDIPDCSAAFPSCADFWYNFQVMAEEAKVKLLETEEVRQRIEDLKKKVGEMADYIHVDDRRAKLAELEAQQASGDFWNNQAKAKEVIAATNAERAYVVPFTSLTKTVEDAGFML